MKLQQRIAAGFLATVLALSLAACGGGSTPSSSSTPSSTSGKPASSSSAASSGSSGSSKPDSSSSTSSTPSSSSSSDAEAKKIIWSTETSNGITSITGYSADGAVPSGDIIIPTKLGGKEITQIGSYFLRGNKNITSITIPGTIKIVGSEAFRGCTGLKTVIVQEGVETIREYAFEGCISLENVTLPESLTELGNHGILNTGADRRELGHYNGVFANCTALKQIKLPSKLSSINADTFSGCISLERIYIPYSVTSIWYNAFADCKHLNDVYYGGYEDDWADVQVKSGNGYLSSVENVYFHSTGF